MIFFVFKALYKFMKKRFKIKSININGILIELECDDNVKKLANEVWIELSTRKIALPFDEENDVIVEVYNSWYKTFEMFRKILKDIPLENNKNVDKLTNIILEIINGTLRNHLTRWQARFRKWYKLNECSAGDPQEIQKKYPYYNELVADLKKVNYNMIELKNELNKIRRE